MTRCYVTLPCLVAISQSTYNSSIHSPLISYHYPAGKGRDNTTTNMTKVNFTLPPAADKVTSLFHSKKHVPPVFNQPLNTSSCPHHRIARLLYSVFLSLLLIIAIPVITLKALTYSFIEDNRRTGFTFQTTRKDGEPGDAIIMAALPRMLYAIPAKLAIIAATLSICLAAAHIGLVVTDWKMGKRVRTVAI